MFENWQYVTLENVKNIKEYHYTAGSATPLENRLNVFWNFIVSFLPVTIAPNVVTLAGFLASLLAFFSVTNVSSNLATPPSQASCFCFAIGVFLHQTLDAIDGKQARITKMVSPLGSVFDHGCDIFTASLVSMGSLVICRCDIGLLSFLILTVSSQFSQFIYLWWDYHFHVFFCNPGFGAGVTEAQCIVILLAIITGIFGSHFWLTNVLDIVPFQLRNVIQRTFMIQSIPLNTLTMISIILSNIVGFFHLLKAVVDKKEFPHKRQFFLEVFSFCLFIVFEWLFYSSALISFGCNLFLVNMLIALVYGVLSLRLLLSATCKIPFTVWKLPVVPFCVLASVFFFAAKLQNSENYFYSLSLFIATHSTFLVFGTVLFYFIYVGVLVSSSVRIICHYLNVSCFTVPQIKKE